MEQNFKQIFEALTRSSVYLEFQEAFSEATGLPLSLRAPDWWQLPLHGQSHENPFCALLAEGSRACAMCLQMQQRLSARAQDRPATLSCWFGLTVAAVPVRVGGQLLGFLRTGQVFRTAPTEGQYERSARLAAAWGVKTEAARLRRAYFRGAILPPRNYSSVVEMLTIFAGHLSLLGEQIATQQKNAEPDIIRRAKEFIRERHTENLRLSQVAQAVNSSPFYFCKLFRKATGRNFTQYVSRVRIEKAKNLLLNPDLQVSEIAYAVGFQSLTHFNRVFKTLVHQAPTRYRRQVVGVPRRSLASA